MKKQVVIIGSVVLLVCVGLSGCNQNTVSPNTITGPQIEIKLINRHDKVIDTSVEINGFYYEGEYWSISQDVNSGKVNVTIDAGGEKSVYFNNLKINYEQPGYMDATGHFVPEDIGVRIEWRITVYNAFAPSYSYPYEILDLQTDYNITSILNHGATIIFHPDGTITKEGKYY